MFKKILFLVMFFLLSWSTGSCEVIKLILHKIGVNPRHRVATYKIILQIDNKSIYVDTIVEPEEFVKSDSFEGKNIDVNSDGTLDYVLPWVRGRGWQDYFYVVDGKTKMIIFHCFKSRPHINRETISRLIDCEGRGSRHFVCENGKIIETIDAPFAMKMPDSVYRKIADNPKSQYYRQSKALVSQNCPINAEYRYIYVWDGRKFNLSETNKRFYYHDKEKVYI